jgi:hypothetical protein
MNGIRLTLVLTLLLESGTIAAARDIPDLPNCRAWLAYEGPETPTLLVVPDGSGSPFTEALLPDGTTVDATVFLEIRDGNDTPVANFPFEDLWLESADDGLQPCQGGTCADANTDELGMTYWIQPLRAGGHSQALTQVLIMGDPWGTEGLALSFNSPDINGDGQVDIQDVGNFAQNLFGTYDFRSDLARDGLVNLADLGRLIQGLGRNCP